MSSLYAEFDGILGMAYPRRLRVLGARVLTT